MKRIKEYKGDPLEFHKNVVDSKHKRPNDPTFKERIGNLNAVVIEQFNKHDALFKNDDLASLSPIILTSDQENDLKALYDYNTKPFQELKDILTTGDKGNRQPICPFCTINNVNTFDHLIPKNEFSELSDHPVNLMPCCSECNSKKSSNWREGNTRKYLNLYLDDLPDIQYLFVDLSLAEATIKATFYVENKNGIDYELFKKIDNHYKDLELCKRFSLNCDNTISELKHSLKHMGKNLSKEQLKESVFEIERENQQFYGFNYWRSVVKIECCKNNLIFDFMFQ